MKNFKLTCPDGFTTTLQAEDMNSAVDAFMGHADVQAHVMEAHPEMAGKTPEEMKAVVMTMVTEVEAGEENMTPSV